MSDEPIITPASGDAGLIARLAAQRQKFKAAWKTLADRSAKLTEENRNLKELVEAAGEGANTRKVEELTGKLRGLTHRAEFDKQARKAGATEEALDDLWDLAKIAPTSDTPDAEAIGVIVAAQKTKPSLASAFGVEAPPADPNAPPPLKPAPGSGKGGSTAPAPKFSEAQLSDPAFVMNNFAAISQAASERIASGQV